MGSWVVRKRRSYSSLFPLGILCYRRNTPNRFFVLVFLSKDELKDSLASSGTYIKKSLFDSTVLLDSGQTLVEKYTLCNSWIEVDIIDFGATVTAVRVYDGYQWTDVVLGFDNVAGSRNLMVSKSLRGREIIQII